jgi:hypothetical protein
MAVADAVTLLAKWGQRVLVVYWDLEAPGLEKFFERWLSGSRKETPGLVDLMHGLGRREPVDWRSCLLKITLPEAQRIHLISAGRDDSDYGSRLHALSFEQLFKDHRLGSYLEELRREWTAEYDFVLIDSRTGITDIGGICTIHLPDVLVCLFTTTEQSLAGVKDVIQRAQRGHARLPVDRRRLLVVPVPARDESRTEYKLAADWRQRFASELASIYEDWIPKDETPIATLDLLKIPYVAYWSFGERLPVLEEDTENPDKLGFFYQQLARLILARLDLKEVKQGGQAARAREEQKQASERRAKEAELARERAAAEAAMRELDQHEREQHFLRKRVQEYMSSRWEPAVAQFHRDRRDAIVVGALGFAALGTILSTWFLVSPSARVDVARFVSVGVITMFSVLSARRARQNAQTIEELRREQALYGAGASSYKDQDENEKLDRFISTSERLISIGRYRQTMWSLFGPPRNASTQLPPEAVIFDRVASTEPESSPETAAPIFSGSRKVMSDRYDVYVSYPRDRVTTEWLREFLPLFSSWLSEHLPSHAELFFDETDVAAVEGMGTENERAIERSSCLLAVVSPAYFNSQYTSREWEAFKRNGRPIFPLLLKGAPELLPRSASQLQMADFREFAIVGEGFRKTERYVDFQMAVRKLAEDTARVITDSRRAAASA